jgi:hypothetical protein
MKIRDSFLPIYACGTALSKQKGCFDDAAQSFAPLAAREQAIRATAKGGMLLFQHPDAVCDNIGDLRSPHRPTFPWTPP